MLETLKQHVYEANLDLARHGLVILTWGNVSGLYRESGLVVIKPSGVSYERMRAEDMVVVDLQGRGVEGDLRPSSDTPTHLALYRAFPHIGGITHTHSTYATMFAQAQKEIPCLGTTHADHFYGPVPVTRTLTREEVEGDYEAETGQVIVERFAKLDAKAVPAVLVANHGPFAWGGDAGASVKNAVALEEVAKIALGVFVLNPDATAVPQYLLDKHFLRKHGADAYYGQK